MNHREIFSQNSIYMHLILQKSALAKAKEDENWDFICYDIENTKYTRDVLIGVAMYHVYLIWWHKSWLSIKFNFQKNLSIVLFCLFRYVIEYCCIVYTMYNYIVCLLTLPLYEYICSISKNRLRFRSPNLRNFCKKKLTDYIGHMTENDSHDR